MNYFLSKYYLLEKENLPKYITGQTIESLAQQDIPGIFNAIKLNDVHLSDAQIRAIKDFRTNFAKNYNYTPEWMSQWERDFSKTYGSLNNLLAGWAWVTLVPTGAYVVAQGKLVVWRIRANELPLRFETHDAIEPTQMGDIWFITWDKEIAQPMSQLSSQPIALHYAEKLHENKTSKNRFDILSIENQVDINTSYPNSIWMRRVTAIRNRLAAAAAQKKGDNAAVISPQKKESETLLEMPFIDRLAAYLIQQQTADGILNGIVVDNNQTYFYTFSIDNQKFKYQTEIIVPHSKTLKKLFQLETASVKFMEDLQSELFDILEATDADLLTDSINHADITYQDVQTGLREWQDRCAKNANQKIRHLCSDHPIATLLEESLKMVQQPVESEILSKKKVMLTAVPDTIYPDLKDTIFVEFYDIMNQLYAIPILKAGMNYPQFSLPHYSPIPCWLHWNQNPILPTLKVGHQIIKIPDLTMGDFGTANKIIGNFELKSFKIGLSVTRHAQIKLHLETHTVQNQYFIGKL